MPPVWVPFDGWTPSASYFGEGWSTASDMAPIFNTWRPARKFAGNPAFFTTFGPMTGRHTHLWPSGTGTTAYIPDAATLFCGSKTRLFTVDPVTGFSNVSRAANYAALGDPAGWRFASVGNDVWATNWLDPMQRRVANAGLFTDGVVSTFAPVARHLAVVREHLLAANLRNAGRFVDELAWSDADNATNFDPPTATSTSIAGSKRLVSIPGQITGLLGGQYGLAFKRRCIYYLEATGTTQVIRPDILSPHVGTAYGSSIINSRYGIFFFGPDGFYRIVGLSEPQKLSTPGIDAEILSNLFAAQGTISAQIEDFQMFGFHWPSLPLIGWLFRYDWQLPGNNRMILHNPVTGVWSTGAGTVFLEGEGSEPYATVVIERPYGSNLYDAVAALSWDTVSVTQYAPASSTLVRAPSLQLRFRPANAEGPHQVQRLLKGVLPVFSKTAVSGAALAEAVTVECLLDPHNDVWKTEGPRLASQRDVISGFFPFEIAGRYFRISIAFDALENADFASFEGVYVDIEDLP